MRGKLAKELRKIAKKYGLDYGLLKKAIKKDPDFLETIKREEKYTFYGKKK